MEKLRIQIKNYKKYYKHANEINNHIKFRI